MSAARYANHVRAMPLLFDPVAIPSGIPFGISGTALAISTYAAVSTRARDRRDLYLKMQQHLIEPDQLEGRSLLFLEVHSVADVTRLFDERRDTHIGCDRRRIDFLLADLVQKLAIAALHEASPCGKAALCRLLGMVGGEERNL